MSVEVVSGNHAAGYALSVAGEANRAAECCAPVVPRSGSMCGDIPRPGNRPPLLRFALPQPYPSLPVASKLQGLLKRTRTCRP